MPSNKELTATALEIAEELDIEIDTKGLNNKELAELVSDLKAKQTDANKETIADEPKKEPEPEIKETKAHKGTVYKIAKGKALTSKKGILGPDEEVTADYLHGGGEALKSFIESGHIVKDES